MKILITGIDGMIGHKIAQSLSQDFYVIGSTRKNIKPLDLGINKCKLVKHDFLIDDTEKFLENIKPDVIINCVGITIRRGININIVNTKLINSDLPHIFNNWVEKNNKKLIHFSSDCVFDGKHGNYLEHSKKNAQDIYGRTKSMGEINGEKSLTIRCSIIGREIFNYTELFEWLYSMKNKSIHGYKNVIYSGVTSNWMGNLVKDILKNNIELSGLYNISSIPISKYDLLVKLSKAFNLGVKITCNTNIKSNKVLISKKFTEITGVNPPSWDDLIVDFKEDSDKYSLIYKT